MLDGGAKNKEFNTYTTLAKSNDFILLHDFARNYEKYEEIYLEKQKWLWHESGFEEFLNLDDVVWAEEELLEQCAWGTYKKL